MKVVSANISNNLENKEKALVKNVMFAGNGVFEEMSSWLGTAIKKVNDYELGKEFPNIEESLEIYNKKFEIIPVEAIMATIKWYRYITLKNGEEAQINFYRLKGKSKTFNIDDKQYNLNNIEGIKFWSDEIFSYIPLQYNSGALTEVAKEDEFYDRINEFYGLYVETHSHNSMSAFRSGTDEKYSYNDGIQLVFGKLDTEDIEMYSWACIRGLQRAGLSEEELKRFIGNIGSLYNDNDNKLIFHSSDIETSKEEEEMFEEWCKRVVERPITVKKTYTNGLYSNYDLFDDKYYSNDYIAKTYLTRDEKIRIIQEDFMALVPDNLKLIAELISDAYIAGLSNGYGYISDTNKNVGELIDLLEEWQVFQ